MRYCSSCGVKLANDIETCPLCDMHTERVGDDFALDYPYIKSRFNRRLLIKLITFTAIVVLAASFMVDHLVPTGSPWVFITAAGIAYAWISAINILRYTPNPASIILCQLISIGGLTFAIDFLTGYHRWSVSYVIPFLIMAASIALTLMLLIRPMKYRALTIYQLVVAVLGVMSVLLWVVGFTDVEWPLETAALVAVTCFALVLVFSRRRTQSELKKRFHI